MRIAVVGAGGVGGYFGAKLARAGESVLMLARGPHLAAIRRDGLRVRSAPEGESLAKVEAVDSFAGQPAVDMALFCVKSFDTRAAAEALRPVLGPSTGVVSLQNGVDNEETIDEVLGRGVALGGAAYVFAGIDSPGVIRHTFAGRIAFGELDGRVSERATRLRDALAHAGVPVDLVTDIRRVLWEKYLLISAQAGMTALSRCPAGVLRETPESWRMYRLILEELAAVARAAGVTLSQDVVDVVLKQAAAIAPGAYSSLHDDLIQGKRLELETLHGHAVRLGERHGVPTPMVFAVYAALKPHVAGRRG
ncbi:MAG TPA: 2-dehydropantoate 2-reductase [Methylomirabilota bacterium]|nr:2-dehydropantoate 2-reductase [Methylomirabilota bacterium]